MWMSLFKVVVFVSGRCLQQSWVLVLSLIACQEVDEGKYWRGQRRQLDAFVEYLSSRQLLPSASDYHSALPPWMENCDSLRKLSQDPRVQGIQSELLRFSRDKESQGQERLSRKYPWRLLADYGWLVQDVEELLRLPADDSLRDLDPEPASLVVAKLSQELEIVPPSSWTADYDGSCVQVISITNLLADRYVYLLLNVPDSKKERLTILDVLIELSSPAQFRTYYDIHRSTVIMDDLSFCLREELCRSSDLAEEIHERFDNQLAMIYSNDKITSWLIRRLLSCAVESVALRSRLYEDMAPNGVESLHAYVRECMENGDPAKLESSTEHAVLAEKRFVDKWVRSASRTWMAHILLNLRVQFEAQGEPPSSLAGLQGKLQVYDAGPLMRNFRFAYDPVGSLTLEFLAEEKKDVTRWSWNW